MATASITYDYDYGYSDYWRYCIQSRHTSNSGEYISPPVSYVDRYGYCHFNKPIPTLKKISCTYHFYSSTTYFFNVSHALYVRVGNSWYSTSSFTLTRKTSDDPEYSYMAEYKINVAVNRNNVTDFCILPTSMPSSASTWSSWADTTDSYLKITESLECNEFIDSNYISNISALSQKISMFI